MTRAPDAPFDTQEKTPEWAQTPHGNRFFMAFRRLCDGRSQLVPKGAGVSQNNVAKEAGLHPTALKRTRYPELIELIKQHKASAPSASKPKSKRDKLLSKQETIARLRRELELVKKERDEAQSKLTTVMLETVHMRAQFERVIRDLDGTQDIADDKITSIDSKLRESMK